MSLERTLVILKPSAVQRGLIGEITSRFERKGLRLVGMKMMQLTDDILNEHYAHLSERPFFQRVKESMMASPVVACCYEGVDAIQIVRSMTGATNGRVAVPGTIRGDFSVSSQENIIHTSDSPKTAAEEVKRFFKQDELFDYKLVSLPFLYYSDEYQLT
ncbi:nucleoside-diphosphate kinase [Phocaeicola faecicola]|jgi:nucleoside-diphosphate kinase|uniref:nucleoside-diphosphate kinase n=1 Tax=Phocaeicola faecicola TaxID=2739389 RepID=UPI0015B72D37|nr:nucleoside-diphosphate kinase [Phocaeicola faecicola]MCI5743593.1 nucleoside-diphosphate kinase [Bacteroides sp.]MCI7180717.1 nucleoside-diphosphate kinase [Lachnospiraceae bacterium]MDD6908164.1 nucleoside-diphosphate kinase [Bacteroidaceae bacterium]MDY4871179.1 nucleoside-diphosphate kinase [Phocaeicola faecicola]